MRAAARLQIDADDLDEPDAAGAGRRLDRHGLDQTGVGGELLVVDPARADFGVFLDQLVEPPLDVASVENGLAGIEIEPAVAVADRTAGDGVGQHGGQQVQRAMGAHAPITQLPVEPRHEARADRGQRGPLGGNVQDGAAVDVVDGVDDLDRGAVGEDEPAAIARLAAAAGVEDRGVEYDAAGLGGDDARLDLAPIGVLAKERFGHLRGKPRVRRRVVRASRGREGPWSAETRG